MVEACLVDVEFAAVRGIVVMAGSQLRCDENNCNEIWMDTRRPEYVYSGRVRLPLSYMLYLCQAREHTERERRTLETKGLQRSLHSVIHSVSLG